MPSTRQLTRRSQAGALDRTVGAKSHPQGDRPIVAVVTDAILPFHKGGKEVLYAELTTRLAQRADVHVYTMHWWDGRRRRQSGDVTLHGVCHPHPMYAGGRRSIRQGVSFAVGCSRLIWRRFDIVYADQMPHLHLFVLWVVSRVRRRPFVVSCHEVWGRDYWRSYLGRLGSLAWWMEKTAMRLPDTLIASGDLTAERLRRCAGPGSRVVSVPYGVDLGPIRRAQPAVVGSDVVVVGRLLEHKRIDLLIEALAVIRERGTDLHCRVIGTGPDLGRLREASKERGVADLVEFMTDVDTSDELFGLVKAATVFAFPSEREGFGIAVLEALACGVPVVTTSAPDNLAQELARSSGHGEVCEPTAEAFADAIESQVAIRLENGGAVPGHLSEWLSAYDWDAVACRIGDVLFASCRAPHALATA